MLYKFKDKTEYNLPHSANAVLDRMGLDIKEEGNGRKTVSIDTAQSGLSGIDVSNIAQNLRGFNGASSTREGSKIYLDGNGKQKLDFREVAAAVLGQALHGGNDGLRTKAEAAVQALAQAETKRIAMFKSLGINHGPFARDPQGNVTDPSSAAIAAQQKVTHDHDMRPGQGR